MCQEGKVPISSMFVSASLCCVGRDSRCNSKRHLHTCDCDVLPLRLRNCILSFHVTWTRQVNHGRPCHLWAVFYRRKRTLCQDHLWALTLFCNLPKFSQTWAHSCVNCSSIPQLEKKYSQLELGCAPCHLYYFLLLWCMAGEETIHMIMNILYHLYIKSIIHIHICCRERSKYAQHWPWNYTLLYPSLSMINSCHEVLAQMKSQFQIVEAEAVTFSFCQASGRQVMPTATWSRAKNPRQVLESWYILGVSVVRCSQAQGKKESKAPDRNLMKFVVAVVSVVLCSKLCATALDGVEWGQACVYQCQPTLARVHRDSTQASPSRTELNRYIGKSEEKLQSGYIWAMMAMDGHGPVETAVIMENPCGSLLRFLLPCWKTMNGRQ